MKNKQIKNSQNEKPSLKSQQKWEKIKHKNVKLWKQIEQVKVKNNVRKQVKNTKQ